MHISNFDKISMNLYKNSLIGQFDFLINLESVIVILLIHIACYLIKHKEKNSNFDIAIGKTGKLSSYHQLIFI